MKSLIGMFSLLAILSTVFITSCQKEETQEITTEDSSDFRATVDFRAIVLQLAFGIPADQIDSPESAAMYNSMMESLTSEELAQLEEFVQTYTAQMNTAQMNTTPGGLNLGFRNSSETILSAGINADGFGKSIAKSGNTLFVGAPGNSKVYVYQNDVLVQTLSGGAGFGSKVASSANWLAVLVAGTQVVLFRKQGNAWVENSTISPGFQFASPGGGLAMHGNTLAVMGNNGSGFSSVSVIEVYKLTGNTWSLETTLQENNAIWWDMDIHGNTIVANGGNGFFGFFFSPRVYIYEESGLTTVPLPGGVFARYVAIHNSKIVANTFDPKDKSYVITPSSGTWAISAILVNPLDEFVGGLVRFQGRELAIEGSKVVVTYPSWSGCCGAENNDANDAAYVFEQSGSAWNLTETLTPSTGGNNILYGYCALVKGNQVIVGASDYLENAPAPGAVFIYE